ncbi:MAG: S8 family serine peptidase [Acidobacteria bacterium]|nr:S8 family serine peptidase [Acidobacteriota bacterium]
MNVKKSPLLILILCLTVLAAFGFTRQRTKKQIPHTRFVTGQKIPTVALSAPPSVRSIRQSSDQVLVKFKSDLSIQTRIMTLSHFRSNVIRHIPQIDVYQIQIPGDLTVDEMLILLEQNPDVEYAEPNPFCYTCVSPNDTLFQYQYALYNSAQSIGIPGSPTGKLRADIKATEGWEETKGSDSIVVAVLDSGLDFEHPDMVDIAFSRGRDFVNDDDDAMDDLGHGTYISSIIAANSNNGEGIAGITWNCKILPVKVIAEDGSGLYVWMIEAIIWAADQGAHVINMSIGGDAASQTLEDALKYAYQKGVVIVASAGNDSGLVIYPAAYDNYVLAVAATDYNDTRTPWSNSGSQIDVAAPGDRIIGCYPVWALPGGTLPYVFGFGTSASAAYTSGLAALIVSIKPWLRPNEVLDIIRFSSDDVNGAEYPGFDEFVGHGRINMEKALVPIKIK